MTGSKLFPNGLQGQHVLAMICGFFGAVFAVTGLFMYFALTTFPGSDPTAYRRGLYYNRILAEEARQDRVGWRVAARYDAGRLVVDLRDARGAALAGEEVVVLLGRPTTSRFDRTITLAGGPGGRYEAPQVLEPGSWTATVRVNPNGRGTPFNVGTRLWVEQP